MPGVTWITTAAASDLVSVTLSDNDLERAAVDVYDEMRWKPDPTQHLVGETKRRDALGRAIAWEAAARKTNPRSSSDGDPGSQVVSESLGHYSVTYQQGKGQSTALLSNRALSLLRQYGLYRMTGSSEGEPGEDEESITRIS
jgi:hypothetical protein